MIAEFEDIAERMTGPAADNAVQDIKSSARALLDRQFIYADDHQGRRRFEFVRRHRSAFAALFDTLGFDLVVDDREQFVGIVGQTGETVRRMGLHETLFLLALRVLYEERIREFMMKEGGRCDATLSELWTLIDERAGRARPSNTRCRQIVADFQRNGIVRAGEDLPEGDLRIEIRPVISRLVTAATLESLERYAAPGEADVGSEAALDEEAASGLREDEENEPAR